MNLTSYLTFSDAAKYAIIARNLVNGNGFVTDFSFWGQPFFGISGIPYLIPHILSLFMRTFGTNDFAVIAFSSTFYFLLVFAVYLLADKLFGKVVGLLSGVAVAFNPNFIDYARSGASEPLFIFEIVFASYLVLLKRKWSNLVFVIMLLLIYLSRPQAFIYMGGLIFFWLLLNLGLKRGSLLFLALGIAGLFVDRFVIYPLSFKYPVTPVLARGMQSILTYSSNAAVSDALRGSASSTLTMPDIFKKLFYNIYNFYKLVPEILNPYLWAVFIISLFRWSKDSKVNVFKIYSIFILVVTFIVTALSIPFFRYLHPVVPFVYILAVETLVWLVIQIFEKTKDYRLKILDYRLVISQKLIINLSSIICILVLAVGQTLGMILLDSRFEKRIHNIDKPPVYVLLSNKLKERTDRDDVIVTNLDTWGSWYGERKTVWFPLEPEMLKGYENQFNRIFLTSYRIGDANYFMGDSWREIFDNPENQKILPDYELSAIYQIKPEENYEREPARAVLLTKKRLEL